MVFDRVFPKVSELQSLSRDKSELVGVMLAKIVPVSQEPLWQRNYYNYSPSVHEARAEIPRIMSKLNKYLRTSL